MLTKEAHFLWVLKKGRGKGLEFSLGEPRIRRVARRADHRRRWPEIAQRCNLGGEAVDVTNGGRPGTGRQQLGFFCPFVSDLLI
ncbi:hypothetical protein ES319_A13G037100v1 [Gossypium barbadense]|uniref:Uncharacterized protein n=2 Tax=Gossypium TaxID=3633 RepID=A0A5J5SUT0_GOSBA|nr:hypothetical protein ES319_A13G037100v1 [Gossypium barbadense]TYG85219.1 hypothetical protein ES288_A13G035600v1 [Gossypium darwinii]